MNLNDFFRALSDYGVPVLCSAILIITFVRLTINQERIMHNTLKKVLDRIDNQHPSPQESNSLDKINNIITELLQKIQIKLNSDRAYLFLYHNGGKSLSGLSFQKMSCINEVVGRGIAPCTKTSQALYRANYHCITKALKEDGSYVANDVGLLEDDEPFTYYFFKDRHAESVYIVPLEDSDGYIIGFIGIEYCSRNFTLGRDFIIKTLKCFSGRIAALVDIKNNSKH